MGSLRGLASATRSSRFGQEANPGAPPCAFGSQSIWRKPKAKGGCVTAAGAAAASRTDCGAAVLMIVVTDGSSGATVSPIDADRGVAKAPPTSTAASTPAKTRALGSDQPPRGSVVTPWSNSV